MQTKRIYLIRHGETSYNIEGIVQGRLINSNLNLEGLKQRDLLCERFKDTPVKQLYLSTLKRTYQTMEPLIQKGLPYCLEPDLDELNFGEIEGTPIYDANGNSILKEVLLKWKSGALDVRFEGGETPLEALDRAKRGMTKILSKQDETPIIICLHQRILRIVMCHILNKPLTQMDDYPHHNTGVTTLDYCYQKDEFSLVELDNIDHLNSLLY
jgi:broad specificity phosphatase PhoE